MRVRVLLFGAEAAAVGRDNVEVDLGSDLSCEALKSGLRGQFPALAPHLPAARVAVNSDFAAPDRVIGEGDEVALIGLVSGG